MLSQPTTPGHRERGSSRAPHFHRHVARGRRALTALLACCSFGCQPAVDPSLPDVVLITIDTTRADHCSVYGYERETTPNLERFAAEGARFDLAYAPMAVTAPAHASLFTSLYPVAHGVERNTLKLAPEARTVAEILRAAGYQTAAILSSFVMDARFGLAQGFDTYEDDFDLAGSTLPAKTFWGVPVGEGHGFDRQADATSDMAIDVLEGRLADRPLFLFVHYMDPHAPYVPPEPFRARFSSTPAAATDLAPDGAAEELTESSEAATGGELTENEVDLYDAEIAYTDSEIARLLAALDRLGVADDALVILTADHGEGLKQRGLMGHGFSIHEEQVRVPLLIRWPGRIPAGRVVTSPVELVDVLPTLLDLIDLEPRKTSFQGRSFARLLLGEASVAPERPVFLHRRYYSGRAVEDVPLAEILIKGEKFGVRVGDWKYVEAAADGPEELFHLGEDPAELENLAEAAPEKVAELAARLAELQAEYGSDSLTAEMLELSPADQKRLEALGYLQ